MNKRKAKIGGIETQPDPKALDSAFQIAKKKQVHAIMTIANRPFFAERKRIVEFAGKNRLPAIYSQKEFVDERASCPTERITLISIGERLFTWTTF